MTVAWSASAIHQAETHVKIFHPQKWILWARSAALSIIECKGFYLFAAAHTQWQPNKRKRETDHPEINALPLFFLLHWLPHMAPINTGRTRQSGQIALGLTKKYWQRTEIILFGSRKLKIISSSFTSSKIPLLIHFQKF